jgi:deaminated glutathione amidase
LPMADTSAGATADGQPRARNTSLAFAPSGECTARYDKMHLFRFDDGQQQFDETRVLSPGHAPVHFDLPSRDGHTYRIGMSVCYDLRFPELYRAMAADVLLVPSAFTYVTGQAHWELLLRARAIENLAYVVAPAQGGLHENGRRTWGHSLIAGPWGEVLAALPAADGWGEAVVLADVQRAEIDARRSRLPALSHRVLGRAVPPPRA